MFPPDNIREVSYIGKPRSYTAMFLSAKAGHLLRHLEAVEGCLIFAEESLVVPEELAMKHKFHFSTTPQWDYYCFTVELEKNRQTVEQAIRWISTKNGAHIAETAKIGDGVAIAPGAVIGPEVEIGDNCTIGAHTVIKRARLGSDVRVADGVSIGADAFNLVQSPQKEVYNMPTLGRVEIADNVGIGAQTVVAAGLAGTTVIDSFVQIDSFCHIHHDCNLGKRVELASSVKLGGFVEIGEDCFIGIGSSIKNRIQIGERAIIGMGSVVIRDIPADITVYGVPASSHI